MREQIARYLYSRFRPAGTPVDDLEDAISAAMCDLVDYWVELPSSVDKSDPERNYKWAIWRGKRFATSALVRRFQQLQAERPGISHGEGCEDDDLGTYEDRAAPSTEETVLEGLEQSAVSRFIDGLPKAVTSQGWFGDVLAGTTETSAALGEGISQQAMSKRRIRGMRRVRLAAIRAGL